MCSSATAKDDADGAGVFEQQAYVTLAAACVP